MERLNKGLILSSVVVGAFFAVSPVFGMVAATNGNYFTGFKDIKSVSSTKAPPLEFDRTYNSRSQYEGMCGYGWGTEYESFCLTSVDGSVIVQESGGGERTRFVPKEFSKKTLDDFIAALIKARAAKGAPYTKEDQEKLVKNADFRDEEGRNLNISPRLAVGTKLYSSDRGDKQSITVLKDGYLREFADGKKSYFQTKVKVKDSGVGEKRRVLDVHRITKFEDPSSGLVLNFRYNKNNGNLEEIADGKTQSLRFTLNTEGKVTQIQDKTGKKATYKYCPVARYNTRDKCSAGDLIESLDAGNNLYKYEYDEVHNLTKIIYADGSAEEIAYWPHNSPGKGGAKSVKTRRGVLMEYSYWQDPKDERMNFKTEVKTTFKSGRVSNASYEYVRKLRADGTSYKYKMVTVVDGDKVETIYNECCGQPLQITDASGVTKFDYFPESSLPKMKDTPQDVTTWEYSPKFVGKVTKVTVLKKGSGPGAGKAVETIFDYNSVTGNLEKARASDGRGVAIVYDAQNRIKTMVDQEKRKISFEYNANSKPIEIRQEGVGSIVVVYDETGNIREVQPKGGKEVALTVTEAFQNLLLLIKPAGIQPI